jgi:hypothetical protein
VVRTGLAEALRMSLSPPEGIPEDMVELMKRLDGVLEPRQLATESQAFLTQSKM